MRRLGREVKKVAVRHDVGAAEVVRDYLPALRRFFSRRAPGGEADDLTQEVYLRLHGHDLDTIANPKGYLFRIASSVLADRARRRRARAADAHDFLEEWDHPVEEISPERVLLGREALNDVIAAIEALPPRTRQAFVLHRFEEMKYGEIAVRMGISASSVEKHIMRALQHLVKGLEAPR